MLTGEPHDEAHFWSTHQGAEINLIPRRGDALYGVECKRADAPQMTPSLRIAVEDLGLVRVAVLYPGSRRYALSDMALSNMVEVVPLAECARGGSVFGNAL